MGWWRLPKNNWQKFRRLSRPEQRVLLQALLLLPFTALALRWLGFKRWQSVLARLAPLPEMPDEDRAESLVRQARGAARMVRAAAWHGPYPAGCLPQSLTLWWLLRRQGIASDLRIGVRKEAGRLEAHAWVEHRGLVLEENNDVCRRFVAFDRVLLPAKARSA
jgi:hypothetical protein